MKKLPSTIIALLSAGLSLQAVAVELVLYNWEDYVAESVLEKFTEATGHTVKLVIYDRDKERDEVLVTTGGRGFDVVVVDAVASQILGKNNILKPFNESGYKHIDKRWQESCGNFGLPYMWGTVGIVYRSDMIKGDISSWKELMEPRADYIGRVGMHIDPVDTLIPALKLQGESLNTESNQSLKNAYGMLKAQAPSVATYEYVVSYEGNSGRTEEDRLYLAMAYSGDQYTLNGDDEDGVWQYVTPSEGTGLWVDCLSIPEKSTNKEAALQFIEFLNQPDIAAENAYELWTATPNTEAVKLLDTDILEDETVFPSEAIMSKSETYRILSNKSTSQRNRIVYSLER